MREVWGECNNVEKRTIDVHIKRLRASLNKDGAVNILRTVRGAGYSIDINLAWDNGSSYEVDTSVKLEDYWK